VAPERRREPRRRVSQQVRPRARRRGSGPVPIHLLNDHLSSELVRYLADRVVHVHGVRGITKRRVVREPTRPDPVDVELSVSDETVDAERDERERHHVADVRDRRGDLDAGEVQDVLPLGPWRSDRRCRSGGRSERAGAHSRVWCVRVGRPYEEVVRGRKFSPIVPWTVRAPVSTAEVRSVKPTEASMIPIPSAAARGSLCASWLRMNAPNPLRLPVEHITLRR
jgi:hypothetical protein